MLLLRQKIARLTDAGQRSGLDIAATAAFFDTFLAEEGGADLPGIVKDAPGGIASLDLLISTRHYFETATAQPYDFSAEDEADMAAIRSVAIAASPQVAATPVPDAASAVALPIIAPDAPAAVRAILERIRVRGDDWVITVETGDSLAAYAAALYNDPQEFRKIFEANLNNLATPNTITVGQVLVLPKD